jgi:DNA-binding response OmpR family regulator
MPKQTKILLIDDDPDVHTVVRRILEPKSYQVVSAYDGSEGLRSVVEERPDLIILDVVMPGKHGFDVCRELKTDEKYHFFSNIPVLMLTVYPEDRDKIHLSIRDGMMMEAEDYLQKPVDPPELLRRIEDLLRK